MINWKKICTSIFLVLFGIQMQAQVGIGTTSPEGILDINSDDSGLVIPRVLLMGTDDVSTVSNPQGGNPVVGTIVYNTATAGNINNIVTPGIYYFDGMSWIMVGQSRPLACIKTYTSDHMLNIADNGCVISLNSSFPTTITVPSGLPIGFNVSVYQSGSGQISFVSSGGATISNRLSRFISAGQGAGIGIVSTVTDEYYLTGDLSK